MKKKLFFMVFFALCAIAFAKDQTMWISVNKAPVKSSTGFFARTTATLNYATQVTQTKTSGKWSYITAGKVSGWVATSSLSKRKIVAKDSNFSADADEIALAGKGFNAEIESEYRKSGKANYNAVDSMEKNVVSDAELLQFIKDGELKGAEE